MKSVAVLTSFASLAAASCNYGTSLNPRSSDFAKRNEGIWGYHEVKGPLNWHGLDSTFELCATGTNQSPININGQQDTVSGSSFSLAVDSYASGAEFENLGHNVQVTVSGSSSVGGKAYNLAQFHFHTPSEHHLNGEYFPGEVHFVFEAADSSLAVIGFFIEVATSSDTVSSVLTAALANVGQIPNAGDSTSTAALDFSDLTSLLNSANVAQYAGSLTTPPCDQGVTFNVVQTPLYISVDTFRALKDVVKFNSRYTQNLPGDINLLQNAANSL